MAHSRSDFPHHLAMAIGRIRGTYCLGNVAEVLDSEMRLHPAIPHEKGPAI